MSRGYSLPVDGELATRLKHVDDDWLAERLESLVDEYESRRGGSELAKYDSQAQLEADESLSPAEKQRRLIKWRREIGSRRR